MPPKSPHRIEIWRHEVSASFSPPSSHTQAPPLSPSLSQTPSTTLTPPSEVPTQAKPPKRTTSLWKKLLKKDSRKPHSATSVDRGGFGDYVRKGAEEGQELGRTGMYDVSREKGERLDGLLAVPGEGEDRGSSMEITSADLESSEGDVKMRQRRERLERASRLLGGKTDGGKAEARREVG